MLQLYAEIGTSCPEISPTYRVNLIPASMPVGIVSSKYLRGYRANDRQFLFLSPQPYNNDLPIELSPWFLRKAQLIHEAWVTWLAFPRNNQNPTGILSGTLNANHWSSKQTRLQTSCYISHERYLLSKAYCPPAQRPLFLIYIYRLTAYFIFGTEHVRKCWSMA